MGKLVRMIAEDGTFTVIAADTTDIVARAEQIHKTSAVATAALGRLLTAACFMGAVLKGEKNTVSLRMMGNGPAGAVLAAADSMGNVRGYVSNPLVELPLNAKGKLDVAGAVGTEGMFTVVKDFGLKEPYVGQIPIVSGEIAEDVTNYFATSEQIPTACALGVLVNSDLTVKKAGGFMIQLLPTAMDDTIDKVEACMMKARSATEMLADGLDPEAMCREVLQGFDLQVLDEMHPAYLCRCSRRRVEQALISAGKKELLAMAEDAKTEISCHFCDKKYEFTSAELRRLAEGLE